MAGLVPGMTKKRGTRRMGRAQRNPSKVRVREVMGFAALYPSYKSNELQIKLAQRARMHPPAGVIAPDLFGGAAGFGGVLVDREAGGARSGHPREPGAVGGVERRDHLADHGL